MTVQPIPSPAQPATSSPAPNPQPGQPVATAPGTAPPPTSAPARAPVSKETRALLERERQIQRQAQHLKAERSEAQRLHQEAKALQEKYGKRPTNAIEALQQAGFTYADATRMMMNESEPTPDMLARRGIDEVERLRAELTERDRVTEEQRTASLNQQVEQVIEDTKADIRSFTAAKPQDYELLNIFGAHEAVYYLIEQHFNETERILSLKEASDLVERHLDEQVAKAQAAKNRKAVGQPGAPEAGRRSPVEPGRPVASGRTVTSEFTSSTPTLAPSPQIEDDRMRRALAALK